MKATLTMYLNQPILQLYKTLKNPQEKNSGWIIDLVIEYNINILKYNLLTGRSYIHLPKELDRPRKGLSNIQNINENACFK